VKDKLRAATPGITFDSGAVIQVPVEQREKMEANWTVKDVLELARDAIKDAISPEDGLDEGAGEAVCQVIDEAIACLGNGERALEAWKHWWEFSGGDFREYEDGYEWCFFCGAEDDGCPHEKDCPYLIVKQIAEEEGW